ncbi:MAG: RluA family pseudouridine synthase [Alphaproteobacteria bacterium]|nr:RluA family pseudouridine synthase [Alphaproteobacteria bacterium]
MSRVQTIKVTESEAGMRLDRWFRSHFPNLKHGELEKLLRKGQVRVEGGRVKASRRLEPGETIRIPPIAEKPAEKPAPAPNAKARREDRDFLKSLILFEDESLIALNKPFGLAVQGGSKTTRHIDGMLAALEEDGERPRLVHRLDRDTGGLLILAKTRAAAAKLGGAFQRHEVDKTYWALVAGAPHPRQGTIDLPIAKRMVRIGEGKRERVVPAEGEDAKKAVTDFQILDGAGAGVSFLALRPRTGRTHQLRVHCAAAGAPIVGDSKYGGPVSRLEGVAPKLHLFCREMTFPHPKDGVPITIRAALSGHMLDSWRFFHFDECADATWPRDLQ